MRDDIKEIYRDEEYVYYEWRGKTIKRTIKEVNSELEMLRNIPSKSMPDMFGRRPA